MNRQRRRRLFGVVALLGASTLVAGLVATAPQRYSTYLYTPSDVSKGHAILIQRFRLAEMVEKGSFHTESGSLVDRFTVTDEDACLHVRGAQLLPDLFREGQAVAVTGQMHEAYFRAAEVLAKHDETYIPRDMADNIKATHLHQAMHDAATPGPSQER